MFDTSLRYNCNPILILFQTNIFSFEILESIYKWKDSLNTVVFCSLWWLKRKAWRTQTFVSYKILLKIRWKVQWRLHKQTSKTFQMHREKGKFKALAYTNWHIDSLRLHFARCECPKLFTSRKINASGKTVRKNINTRFWISQCAQKSAAFGRKKKIAIF